MFQLKLIDQNMLEPPQPVNLVSGTADVVDVTTTCCLGASEFFTGADSVEGALFNLGALCSPFSSSPRLGPPFPPRKPPRPPLFPSSPAPCLFTSTMSNPSLESSSLDSLRGGLSSHLRGCPSCFALLSLSPSWLWNFLSPSGNLRSLSGNLRSPSGNFRSPSGNLRSPSGNFLSAP